MPTRLEMPAVWDLAIWGRVLKPSKVKPKPGQEQVLAMRHLCLTDLYFLLSRVLSCAHLFQSDAFNQDWLYERVREVEAGPNGYIDIWFREGFKSTISTFGLNIQDVLYDPEITLGIFAFNSTIAQGFLQKIKREFESNDDLKQLFPDVLWNKPQTESPKWSVEDGIILRRKGNPTEATIEAWGLIESMPTSRHYNIRDYDDIITERYVTNEDQVKAAIKAWELSLNLGSAVPVKRYGVADIARYKGTRYALNDPYAEIIRRKAAIPRIYPGTKDGTAEGEPVLWSKKLLRKKRRYMGPHTFSAQILCDPSADKVQGFDENWIRRWEPKNLGRMNLYLLVDPANAKGKKNDYTTMGVIALGEDQNYRLVEGIRKRMNLTERTKELFRLHRKYGRLIKGVGYEEYGMQADKQHIEYVMGLESYDFIITAVGGNMPKLERIRRLIPIMEQGRWFLPEVCYFIDEEKRQRNFSQQFIDEINEFPVGAHEDILDMTARILDEDLCAQFPTGQGELSEGQFEQTCTDRGSGLFWRDMPSQSSGGFIRGRTDQNLIELDADGYVSRVNSPGQTQTRQQTFDEVMWRGSNA